MVTETSSALRRRAIIALSLTTVFWGLSFPLIKSLALAHGGIEPGASGWFYTVSSIWPRFIVATVLLGVFWGGAAVPRTRREIWQGVGLALFMSAGLVLQVDGLQHTEASTSAFLSQFFVIILPMVVYGRMRRWPPWQIFAGTALVVAGVAVLADFNWATLRIGRGELETLISTGFFGAQILWLERPVFRGNRPIAVTQAMFVTTAILFLLAAGLLSPRSGAVLAPWSSPPWLAFTGLLAVVCTVGAFTLMNTWQPRLNAAEAGLIYSAEPLFASLMALFLPGWFSALAGIAYADETMTSRLLVGGGLITAANVLVQLRPAQRTGPER